MQTDDHLNREMNFHRCDSMGMATPFTGEDTSGGVYYASPFVVPLPYPVFTAATDFGYLHRDTYFGAGERSIKKIRESFQEHIRTIRNPKNKQVSFNRRHTPVTFPCVRPKKKKGKHKYRESKMRWAPHLLQQGRGK